MRMKKVALVLSLLVMAAVARSNDPVVSKDDVKAVALDGKPINMKCPYTSKAIDATITSEYKGPKDKTAVIVAFCCPNCKKNFDAKPDDGIKKFKEYKAGAQ
jgi:hypothetical protein